MKNILSIVVAVAIIVSTACNNNDQSSEKTDVSKIDKDSVQNNNTQANSDISVVTPTFVNLDPKITSDLNALVDHYLHIKNALANDNADDAARGGMAMADVMSKVDKSLLDVEQKKVYDLYEEDLREHAEHINKNANNITHQREHFATMSEDVYAIAKAYGAGKTLYHDHCPMYNENKGAMWLSETAEIKNPYYGSKMLTCGKVKERIQ